MVNAMARGFSLVFPLWAVSVALAIALAAYIRLNQPVEMTAAPALAIAPDDRPALMNEAGAGSGAGAVVYRSPNGMFYATVAVNGRPARFLVDTGASMIVLSRTDAAEMGIDVTAGSRESAVRGVGGHARVTMVKLDSIELAGRRMRDVEAAIVDEGVGAPLLGQNVLGQLASLTISGNRMVLN